MFSEKEVEKQESTVKKYILIGFIPTIIIVLIIFYFQTYSLDYNKKKYLKSKNKSIKGMVIRKYQEGDFLRAKRSLILEPTYEQWVYKDEYDKISIGDSVIKKKGSDSIFFHLKDGSKLVRDYNKFLREKYQEVLNNKN